MLLTCAGCSRVIAKAEPEQTLAISCTCGAMSPILIGEAGEIYSLPGSLIMAASKEPFKGHLENYLGFSSHESEIKSRLERELLEMGLTHMSDCGEDRCKAALAAIGEC